MARRSAKVMSRRGSPGRFHSGTRAGAARSRIPSPTSMPTTACSMDLATDHERSGVATDTGRPGPSNRGSVPP